MRATGTVEHIADQCGSVAHTELCNAILDLFAALRALAEDHATFAALDGASEPATSSVINMLDEAEQWCTGKALTETLAALVVLRRKVRAVALDLQNDDAVVAQLDAVVTLVVPGLSVQDLWKQHGPTLGIKPHALRDAVIVLLTRLDAHCPE